jgi:hypothetical protein
MAELYPAGKPPQAVAVRRRRVDFIAIAALVEQAVVKTCAAEI